MDETVGHYVVYDCVLMKSGYSDDEGHLSRFSRIIYQVLIFLISVIYVGYSPSALDIR